MHHLRAIRHGLVNLVRFFPVVWAWRDWDYAYSYRLFMFALERLARGIERRERHTGSEATVRDIDEAVLYWRAYVYTDSDEGEQRVWAELHRRLAAQAQGWWD